MEIGRVAEAAMMKSAMVGQELNVAMLKQQNEADKAIVQVVAQATQQNAQAVASGRIDISV
ncbi:MAG: hypothetical protein H7841_14785 [Magnetospirillum sp. WYHS-4]